jgi:hypothetical protein
MNQRERESELLPCPFCGASDWEYSHYPPAKPQHVYCNNCGSYAFGDWWNKRATSPVADGGLRPIIVCLCGSTRFSQEFRDANLRETLGGKIVLTVGCDTKTDLEVFHNLNPYDFGKVKERLDELHKRKIDLADEILVLDVDGYIGSSTKSELEYAQAHGKRVRFLSQEQPALAASPSAAPAAAEGEREAFERWWNGMRGKWAPHISADQLAWDCWQASRKAQK